MINLVSGIYGQPLSTIFRSDKYLAPMLKIIAGDNYKCHFFLFRQTEQGRIKCPDTI